MKGKAEKRYRFRVTVVTDGDRFGLLVERKKADEAKPVYGYFCLKEPEGLGPTPIVREKCGDNCHALERANYHHNKPKKYARFYIQERIFREILAYAKAAAESSNMKAERPLTQEYTDDDRGYPQILHRFFSADPPYELAEFLVASDIFTDCLLRKPDGKDYFVGMAEQFEVRSPNSLFPEENFDLLFTVEKVLRIERPPPARWFRDRGPMFSDFEQKKFYRREEVEVLKEKVFTNRFYLLEGKPATAKTVIVRTLMYELYKKGIRKVYYFDIAPKRHFNEVELIRDIRSTNGIFIIENIHLESRKVQWICERFENDPDRHFLFTSGQPLEKIPSLKSMEFNDTNTMLLKQFKDAELLVNEYCSDSETPSVVRDKRQDILKVSKGDFWLLALALQGCADAKGKGEPISWIADKANEYLRNLETCKDPHDDQYPRILLALSPLYIKEVLTSEKYLDDKMGFTSAALNDLAERGEITRHKDANTNILYGLPHSSRASAFWEHGKEYMKQRNLRDYEYFIYDYAISGTPNGIEAVLSSSDKGHIPILTRLWTSGQLTEVIEAEDSIENINNALAMLNIEIDNQYIYRDTYPDLKKLLMCLSEKINRTNNLYSVSLMFTVVEILFGKSVFYKLWNTLNHDQLAYKMSITTKFLEAYNFLRFVKNIDGGIALAFCEFLDIDTLSSFLTTKGSAFEACLYISEILAANERRGMELWKLLNKEVLVQKLQEENGRFKKGIGAILDVSMIAGLELVQISGIKDSVKDLIREGRNLLFDIIM